MKNIRFWAYTSAFLSLAISLAMIGLWISGVWELKVVELNTFIGIIVSLLAIIVTLAIAWQIYNAVDMKNKVEELKQLEGKLKEQEKSLKKLSLETTRDIYGLMWIHHRDKGNNIASIHYLFISLKAEMDLEEPNQFDDILNAMEVLNKKITVIKKDLKIVDEIRNNDKEIRALSNYKYIKRRYETFYDDFITKVK